MTGPQYVNIPSIANRMQFMTGNKVWQQVATGNVAKSVTLPVCSATHKPPKCFTTKLTDGSKFVQWIVSKPRRQAAAPASSAAPPAASAHGWNAGAANPPSTFNGVDQQALHACLENDPDNCLATVPGLSECVITVRVCNAAALPSGEASEDASPDAAVSADDIRSRAAAAFDVPSGAIAVTPPASPLALTTRTNAAGSGDNAWRVSSTSSTPGLQHADRRVNGFTARYSAHSGALLEACWGDLCDAS
ncbi:hypothetical protein ABZX99_04660 [Streptomyces antibioticus]|uniref:hypothetical protein n=1 Tax=Streptomyces TaxID=1883 RepID=UPI0020CA6F1C|nr:hypothetical protein [Streptomyces sp. CAI-85]